MRRHLILFFLALFLLNSCKDKNNPGNVISKNKMVQMLADIHIIDGSLTQYYVKDSLFKYGTNRYGLLFKKYGVDSVLFNNSVKHYAANPKDMIEIYDSITVRLNFKSDSLGKVNATIVDKEMKELEAKNKAESKKKADSIKRDSIARATQPVKLKTNKQIQ